MTDSQKNSQAVDKLPRAKVRQRRWSFPVMWVVPVVAALVAAYLVYDQVREFGPKVTIRFKDGSGLKAGRTPIQYSGVRIGEVKEVKLSDDLDVVVEARLLRSAASVAREGSVFWIVRLGTELQDISNLGTVITGAYIQVSPGTGEPKSARLLSRHRGGCGTGSPAQRRCDRGGNPGADQTAVREAGAQQLEVLEFKRSGREVRFVQRPGNQCGVAEVAGGRRDRLRHPGRREIQAGQERRGIPSLRSAGERMAGMGAADFDSTGGEFPPARGAKK